MDSTVERTSSYGREGSRARIPRPASAAIYLHFVCCSRLETTRNHYLIFSRCHLLLEIFLARAARLASGLSLIRKHRKNEGALYQISVVQVKKNSGLLKYPAPGAVS
jgi:hypothetical protein